MLGAREAAGQVALRLRDGRRLAGVPQARVVARIRAAVDEHSAVLWDEE